MPRTTPYYRIGSISISDEDQYNMDKKLERLHERHRGRRESACPCHRRGGFSIQPGNREWVSVIECIGMNGCHLPASIIFQGRRIQEFWINHRIDKQTALYVSENGCTDRSIALSWLEHFNRYTQSQTQGNFRFLILDGHTSHISLEFVQYCKDQKIISLSTTSFDSCLVISGCRNHLSSC
jgi:DDE superfamily endonuclease